MATRVVISAPRPAPFFTPLFVAIDKGFLAEQGLEGVMRYQVGLEEMARGEVDFAGSSLAYRSFVEGAPVRQICGLSSRETSHILMVRPEIESPQQLEHILIPSSTGRVGDRFVDELRSILALNGVALEQSRIESQGVDGSHKEQWQMLKEGIGDGATLGAPWWIIAARDGLRSLGHQSDYRPSASGAGVYVAPETIAIRPEVVRGFVQAYVKSLRYCLENVDGTLETVMKFSREWGVDSLEIARGAYDEVAPYWRPEIDLPSLDGAIKQACEKLGKPALSADTFVDMRFLEEALSR
ncbi:MAG: hypothetical protein GEU73_10375 [Chloroflexi bacterium]|nr:hypothetical protein [Chloroflexota bacterium]